MNSSLDHDVDVARSGKWTWVAWIGLAVACLTLVAFRLHAFDLPLENDECNYAYIGGRLLAGDRLYVDVWDHQPFGVFALFAGVIAVFGDAPEVFRCMTTVFSLASLSLIFLILRRLATTSAAISGAILFAIVSSDPGTAGEGCNREIYMNTLILAAWYLALRGGGKNGAWLAASGVALALASMIKTVVAVHWLFLAAWVFAAAWCGADANRRGRSVLWAMIWFAAGPLVLWLAAFAYFAVTDRWTEFIDAVFLFNLSYSGGSESFFARFAGFFQPHGHPFKFDSALPLWIGGIGASVWLIVHTIIRKRSSTSLLVLLVAASFVAVCLPARFWPHYYYLLIPALVIAVSLAMGQLAEWLDNITGRHQTAAQILTTALLAALPVAVFVTEYQEYLSQPLFGITVSRYNSRDFWGRAHGENVRRITDPDDEIFVFGNDAEIYYYSKRRCASRFTMITGLQTGYSGVDRRRKTLIAELEERLPRLILVLFDERHPWDEWRAFLQEHYGQPIGWDFHDRTGEPIMFVLARPDQPVEPIDWNWDRSEVGGWFPGDRR
jgi:hypothetical protein